MFALFVTGGREKVIFDTWAGVKVNWAVGHKKIKVAESQGWEPRASGLRAMDRGKVRPIIMEYCKVLDDIEFKTQSRQETRNRHRKYRNTKKLVFQKP